MVDVHVIAQANRHLYEPLMTHYHQQRYRVFVEERGWKNLARSNSEEHDQFDDENMVYLLAVDNDVVIGGQRVYPSVLPHMLSEVFPHMAQWPLPRSPDTWECSRYFLMRDRRGRAEIAMLVAIQQFCLEEGIRQLTGLAEMATLSRRLQMGIRMRPLGLPHGHRRRVDRRGGRRHESRGLRGIDEASWLARRSLRAVWCGAASKSARSGAWPTSSPPEATFSRLPASLLPRCRPPTGRRHLKALEAKARRDGAADQRPRRRGSLPSASIPPAPPAEAAGRRRVPIRDGGPPRRVRSG